MIPRPQYKNTRADDDACAGRIIMLARIVQKMRKDVGFFSLSLSLYPCSQNNITRTVANKNRIVQDVRLNSTIFLSSLWCNRSIFNIRVVIRRPFVETAQHPAAKSRTTLFIKFHLWKIYMMRTCSRNTQVLLYHELLNSTTSIRVHWKTTLSYSRHVSVRIYIR